MRLGVHFALGLSYTRRCIEVVITVSTRNRVTSKIVRGFESHRLRQQKRNFCLPKVPFLFIQAAGLAYHRHTKCGAYHQGRKAALVSHHAPACILLRLDDIQHSVLMICNSFGIDDIHAFGVIETRECERLLNCFVKYDIISLKGVTLWQKTTC